MVSFSPLDLLYPKRCVLHGKIGEYFCSECKEMLETYQNQKCLICLKSSIDGLTHQKCQGPLSIDGATVAFYFSGPVKDAIYKLKYKWVSDLAGEIVDLVIDSFGKDHFIFSKKYQLCYVPLYKMRENWRGFNQARLFAEIIADRIGLELVGNALLKTKNTKPQVELARKERFASVRHVFAVGDKSKVENCDLLLIDDLRTTGATLRNCAQVLKRAGAKSVWGLTIAAN